MMTLPLAPLSTARDLRQVDASLDGALLRQTGLLATLVSARRETGAATVPLGHAELMRLVRSQQSLLSAACLNDAGELFPAPRKAA